MAIPKSIKALDEKTTAALGILNQRISAVEALVSHLEDKLTQLWASVPGASNPGGGGTNPGRGGVQPGISVVANHLSVATQPATSISGQVFVTQPIIQIRDLGEGVVIGATNLVTASLLSGTGVLSGTLAVNGVNGVVTFTNLMITGGGNHTIQFTAVGLTSVSASVLFVWGAQYQLILTTQPSGAASGIPFTTQPIIQIQDVTNLPTIGSNVVTASILSGTGVLSGTTVVNAVSGVATFTNLVITGSGTHTIQFTSPGLLPTTSSSLNLDSVSTKLALATQPMGAVNGIAFIQQPIVEIRDAFNVKVAGATNTVTATLATGLRLNILGQVVPGLLTGTTVVNAVNGVATFTNLVYTGFSPATIIFTSTGLTSVTSTDVFAVDPIPSGTLLVDTRAGGAQSWQGQGITTTTGALNQILANGSAAFAYEADGVTYGDGIDNGNAKRTGWVTNFDGAGLCVWRGSMPSWGGVPQDGGGGAFNIKIHHAWEGSPPTHAAETPIYSHFFIQWKIWMGRTAAGGGFGSNGVFTINNQGDMASQAGRKMMLIGRAVPAGSIWQHDLGRTDFLWGGLTLNSGAGPNVFSPQLTYNSSTGNIGDPAALAMSGYPDSDPGTQGHDTPTNNTWHTLTIEWKDASTELGADGLVRTWFDGTKTMEALNLANGNWPMVGMTFSATFRSPAQDQTEYYRDIVFWTP